MEEYHLFWLEDVVAKDDYQGLARVADALTTPIAAGEYVYGLRPFRHMLEARSIDIVMIDLLRVGGITQFKKVAGMAEMFGMECIFHGSHGMNLVYSLQVAATIRTCRTQELVFTTPPALPEDAWSPLNRLVKTEKLYTVKDGCVQIPQAPGLGIEIDEEAIERYRVDG